MISQTCKKIALSLIILLFLFFLAGCQSDTNAIDLTVEAKVETAVLQTVSAFPTQTIYPTHTSYPTQTALPTFTSQPTSTSYPTYTPYPTLIPSPTNTVTPMPTPVPTETPIPPTTPPVASTPANAEQNSGGDLQLELLAKMDQTLLDFDAFIGMANPIGPREFDWQDSKDKPTDCQALVNTINRISNTFVVEQPISNPVIENSYNLYLHAVSLFITSTQEFTMMCQDALANGEAEILFNNQRFHFLYTALGEPVSLLNQAANSLRE